ncbi:MAG: hypothetical protein QM654_11055 [Dysgonamonadaceae bacterium]
MRKFLLFILLSLSSVTIAHAQTPVPVASLMDIKFMMDTTAVDISMQDFDVEKFGLPTTLYDPEVKMWVAHFDRTSNTDYWKVDYKDNATFRAAMRAPFTIEVFVKVEGAEEMSPIASMESGGFGLEQVNGGGNMRLWVGADAGGYKKAGNQSIYNASSPEYHHVLYTYDGNNIKTYYDGVLSETLSVGSIVRWNEAKNVYWLAIGGDASVGDYVQGPFKGNVALIRFYDEEIDATRVTALHDQLEARIALTRADELNTMLEETLYDICLDLLADGSSRFMDGAELLDEGWEMMVSMNLTDADITTFLNKVNLFISSTSSERGIKVAKQPTASVKGNVLVVEGMENPAVSIYGLSGIVLLKATGNNIDISKLTPGIYVAAINGYKIKIVKR